MTMGRICLRLSCVAVEMGLIIVAVLAVMMASDVVSDVRIVTDQTDVVVKGNLQSIEILSSPTLSRPIVPE